MYDFWIPISPYVVFIGWLCHLGLNHGPACPSCGTPLPLVLSPFRKTTYFWRQRNSHCQHCGCETEAVSKTAPSSPTPPTSMIIPLTEILSLLVIGGGTLWTLFLK